jgi:hypothetical protein
VSSTNALGPIFAAPELEDALLALIESWLPTYLTEVETAYGLDPLTLARPKFYGTSVEADTHPGEGLPAIIVVSPGTGEVPEGEAQNITAWYDVTVATSTMAASEIGARRLGAFYSAAIRAIVMQHGSIGGVADAVRFLGEEFIGSPGNDERSRSRGGALTHFRVRISPILDRQAGPTEPMPHDGMNMPDLPIAQLIEVEVDADDE